ncbi:4Fe-4S binding protein [Candidatus Micrarchaeota archaeon]|nr:4Fe-4S binding protein [Candidatus Micrarchaeota archaeon]MBU1931030.1 4Fe-4S binding protein [Candidatus Micrarchaeota archaeon]
MPVIINFKICDNSKECLGIQACSKGALYWDAQKKSLVVNESDCTLCGRCEDACEVHAISVAKDKEEAKKIRAEIEADPRTVSDLFVDRYGAESISPPFLISPKDFNVHVLKSAKPTVVELFNCQSIQCLITSIPIKELFDKIDIKFRKMSVANSSLQEKYDVKELPALLFFNNGTLVGKIEGYFNETKKEELKTKISKILQKNQ